MTTPDEKDLQEVEVRRLGSDGSELAVFEFQGQLRDLMISSFQEGYLTTGSYLADAKAVSSQGAQSIALAGAAGGATAISGALSSSLFMATADPSTLMQLKGGVGAAVMGPKGIIAQAPFIPVASSLPIVAPLLAVQTLNSAMMMKQFKEVDKKLDSIMHTLDTVLARIEATHLGELLAASNIVDQVYRQYELEGTFSTDMLTRLALAERDASGLALRFRHLVDMPSNTTAEDLGEIHRAHFDAHSAMLASFVDLRIAYLRVCVDMQENPKSIPAAVEQLKAKLEDSSEFWNQLRQRSQSLKVEIGKVKDNLQDMGAFAKAISRKGASQQAELERLEAEYTSTLENELTLMQDFYALIQAADKTLEQLKTAPTESTPTMVYWKDETGEHSFVSEKLRLA